MRHRRLNGSFGDFAIMPYKLIKERLFAEVQMCALRKLASDEVLPTLSKKTSDLITKECMRRLKQRA